MSENLREILTFIVDKQRFAIHLQTVERVIRAVAVTKLTNSPGFIEGVIDYYGEIIAVINLRKRFGYPVEELKVSDRFIIAITTNRKIALLVDQVEDVIFPDSQDLFDSKDLAAGMELLTVLRDDNGIIMIYDLENLLSHSEEIQLDKLLETNIEQTSNL
jgi:purine-binding chemotaxis protein CheW